MEYIAIIAIVVIGASWYLAFEFNKIAQLKGYNSPKYFWVCLLLGLPGWLLVIALPQQKKAEEQPCEATTQVIEQSENDRNSEDTEQQTQHQILPDQVITHKEPSLMKKTTQELVDCSLEELQRISETQQELYSESEMMVVRRMIAAVERMRAQETKK